MTEAQFEDSLHALCAAAGPHAIRDPQFAAAMITALIGSTAFTISLQSKGDAKLSNTMCEGAAQFLFSECAGKQRLGRLAAFLATHAPE